MSREACLHEALEVKSDYLVFVDTDMVFGTDALPRLLAHGKDVIGGAYNEKRVPAVSTVKMDDGTGQIFVGKADMPQEPFRCIAVGTGFMATISPADVRCPPLHLCMGRDRLHGGVMSRLSPGKDGGWGLV
jgi:hypothetical protein